ncbi:MAG: DUF262 domain-containing protein [Proteobacteria bacterium]|nr:DUF262 domain-containing protein [Pseudomonadota bacterium]
MAYSSLKVHEIVESSVNHAWSVPEFQRGFVWKATQVRDLAESLWLDYPIGSVLVWDSSSRQVGVEERTVVDAQTPTKWLVDGQQRTTALCILSGRRPYWWLDGEDWNDKLRSYDIRFDIDAKEEPYFFVSNAALRRTKTSRYVPVHDLMVLDPQKEQDQQKLQALAKQIKIEGLCDGMDAMEVYARLERLRKIRDREVVAITVGHDLEEVVEIFARLNSKGTRVTEADIYLGVVAARNGGWVREHFLPFVRKLEERGFDLSPNRLFQSLTAVGAKRIRYKQVNDAFWNADAIAPAWKRTQVSWDYVLNWLATYGITTNEILPSDAVFITAVALFDKFQQVNKSLAFEWLLQALRYGRYSASAATSLDEDLKEIETATTAQEALEGMRGRIRAIEPFVADDFLRDYSDARFGRLLLFLLMFRNKAEDWDSTRNRLAFTGNELTPAFAPQFHHIFPRRFLAPGEAEEAKAGITSEQIEALANIAIIGASVNIRISNKNPLAYFAKYDIDTKRRKQQFIEGEVDQMVPEKYVSWLQVRAARLAEEANLFIDELRSAKTELPLAE